MSSDKPSILSQMTESLFHETLKRVSEDVWKKKISDLSSHFDRYDHNSANDILKAEVAAELKRIAIVIVREDPDLQALMKTAVINHLNNLFNV